MILKIRWRHEIFFLLETEKEPQDPWFLGAGDVELGKSSGVLQWEFSPNCTAV